MEIEFIGTGGQGSVVAAKLLANAAVKAGYQSQSFASYGSQIRGGEVEAYVRLDREKILIHAKMEQPDYLVLMDESFVRIPKSRGIGTTTHVILNASKPASAFPELEEYEVTVVDANRIAAGTGLTLPSGLPIINTTILGTVAGILPGIDIDHLSEAFKEGHIPAVEKNIEAARAAFESAGKPFEAHESGDTGQAVLTDLIPEFVTRTAPCEATCPAGEKIERTAWYIQNGSFEGALENILTENPFPGICGRVCFHPCEEKCNRNEFDRGIGMNALERAAYDHADASKVELPPKKASTGKRVAVIGSGPAGLSCAYYLALLGHEVTVFESGAAAGGVPRFGIPEYHLPAKVVEDEVKRITGLGVHLTLNSRVGSDIAFESLTGDYDACCIAAGAHRSSKLGIPGEGSTGVLSGLKFLEQVAAGEKPAIGGKVVVIGGGNVAMDVARTAKRLGATEIHAVCLESGEEMPAYTWETEAAIAEGIIVKNSWGPKEITVRDGKVAGIVFKKCTAAFNSEGKFSPEYDETETFRLECDTVLTAIGETVELPCPEGTVEMAGPVIKTDDLGRTSMKGVYAAGDAASLSRSVVEAIASGKRAALGIDFMFGGGDEESLAIFSKPGAGAVSMARYLTGEIEPESREIVGYEDLNTAHFDEAPRQEQQETAVAERVTDFSEVTHGLTREEAIAEAERCFHCGRCTLCEVCYISCPDTAILLTDDGLHFDCNKDVCKSCGICLYECPRHAIAWEGVA